MTWKVATLWAFGLCALQGTLAEEGGGGAYPEYKVDGPQPKEVPHPDPYKAKEGENVLAVPLQPLNPFGEIKGDDVDKGGDVTKACGYDEPAWSNCDPFELTQHKVLHLVSGARESPSSTPTSSSRSTSTP